MKFHIGEKEERKYSCLLWNDSWHSVKATIEHVLSNVLRVEVGCD